MKQFIKQFSSFLLSIILFSIISSTAFANTPLVVDEVGVLSSSEISKLEERAQLISTTYGIDTAIYTTDTFGSSNPGLFSDKYWHKAGYSKDCSIFVIAVNDRSYYLYNCGEASKAVTDYGSYYIDDKVIPYLKDNNWYKASLQYLNFNSEFYNKYQTTGSAYDIDDKPNEFKMLLIQVFGCTGIGLLISMLVLRGKRKEMKSVSKQYDADNYTVYNNFRLINKNDIFVDRHIITTPLPKDNHHDDHNGFSGGTTMHSGFNGHSFSGHGGRF